MNQNTRIAKFRRLRAHPTKINKFRLENPIECKYSKCRFRCKTTEELEKHIERGYKVRVYVPFGKDWYAYSIRRLKENPDIASYILKDIFRK